MERLPGRYCLLSENHITETRRRNQLQACKAYFTVLQGPAENERGKVWLSGPCSHHLVKCSSSRLQNEEDDEDELDKRGFEVRVVTPKGLGF